MYNALVQFFGLLFLCSDTQLYTFSPSILFNCFLFSFVCLFVLCFWIQFYFVPLNHFLDHFQDLLLISILASFVVFRSFFNFFRWLQWNLDILAGIVVFASAVFSIIAIDKDAGDAGLSVSYALQVFVPVMLTSPDVGNWKRVKICYVCVMCVEVLLLLVF